MEETPTTGNFGRDDELGAGSNLGTGSGSGTGSGLGAGTGIGTGSGLGGGTSTAGSGGTGGVHSHIGVQPSKGEGDSGKFDLDGMSAGTGSGGMADPAREQASQLADQARDRMGDVREQAGEVLGQARNRVSGLMDQAQDSQPVQMARDNPLPALGIAFALGFLLAGSSDTGGRLGKTKQQVKGAVMGGISAALAQELRNALGGQGGGGLIDSLLGNRGGSQQDETSTRGSMGESASQF